MAGERIDVVMPAYRAERTVAAAVTSLIAQTHENWRLLLVSDDGVDYGAVLAAHGIADPRIVTLASDRPGSGASAARNVALAQAGSRYCAVLDADDCFAPAKLERALQALALAPIVSTAIEVVSADLVALRKVGAGEDRTLTPGAYKWVNFSMDSTLAWDRERCDPRYDPAMPNFNDLDFLLRLWSAGGGATRHVGAPLHRYRKLDTSLSSGADMTEKMVRAKRVLIERLTGGFYGLPDAEVAGLVAFLRVSLEAELRYGEALSRTPGLLFEDHLEPLLNAASTSRA